MRRATAVRGLCRKLALLCVAGFVVGALAAVAVPARDASALSEYVSLDSSRRLVDTRTGGATFDGQYAGIGLRPAGTTLDVVVAGRDGVPVDATTAVLTITAVDALDAGFSTVHATGTARPNTSNVNYYPAHNTANTVLATIGTDGKVSIYTSAATHLIVDVAGHFPTGSYTPLANSARLVDTRTGGATFDGQYAGIGLRPAGTTLDVVVAGRDGVPVDATTAVLTITAVDALDAGFSTVHATGTARPNTSNVNYYPAHNTANTVLATIGTDGKVSIFTSAATHLIVDVAGHFPTGSYTPLANSARLVDTRTDLYLVDGVLHSPAPVLASHSRQVDVAGEAGVPNDASAAVLTITAVDAIHDGFNTVHPTGTARPNASNVNYYTAYNTANTVIARLGAGGAVCVFASATTDLLVDIVGYLTGPPPPAAGPECPEAPLDDKPCIVVCPPPGVSLAVAGVHYDETLPLRAGPASDQPVVGNLPPITTVVATGDNRLGWYEVTGHGVTGWGPSLSMFGLNGTFDITEFVVSDLGGTPRAPMLELGLIVANIVASPDEEFMPRVAPVIAPTGGPIGEVTYDVIGFPDDSIAGARLRVTGRHVGGVLYDLVSVESTSMCWRSFGVDGGLCV